MRPNPNADFYIPYFITFDKGLSQIIDLFPLKTILSIKEIDLFSKLFPI